MHVKYQESLSAYLEIVSITTRARMVIGSIENLNTLLYTTLRNIVGITVCK